YHTVSVLRVMKEHMRKVFEESSVSVAEAIIIYRKSKLGFPNLRSSYSLEVRDVISEGVPKSGLRSLSDESRVIIQPTAGH
ncbi:hypothetical protein SK128_027299, partial [Halocaridina rubra]